MENKQGGFLFSIAESDLNQIFILTFKPDKMKFSAGTLILLAGLLIFQGCATIKFYSDPELKKETGLRYYTVKPYLLVEFKAEKDKIKSTIIHLPDLSNPQYVVAKTGIGKTDLKLAFTNSAVTSYGAVSQSMVSETLESVASMLSKSAYAAKEFIPKEVSDLTDNDAYFKLFEIIPAPEGTILREVFPETP